MRSVRVLVGLGVGVAIAGVAAIVFVLGGGGHRSTTTGTFRPPRYLFAGEFNGRAGAKPSPHVWRAKAYRAPSGTVWSGWNDISEDGKGHLVITARKVNGTWFSGFLSGRHSYQGPHRIAVRAKVAAGAGVWNAPVWEWDYPHGVRGLENDVVDQLGRQPETYLTTLHANPRIQRGFVNATRRTLSTGFHTYAAAVRPDRVDYYLDGRLVRSIRPGASAAAGASRDPGWLPTSTSTWAAWEARRPSQGRSPCWSTGSGSRGSGSPSAIESRRRPEGPLRRGERACPT